MDDALFSSEFEPADTRYLWRLWFADVLDLATSALLGWGALRALDVDRTPSALVLAGVGVWLLMSLAGGWSGWTLWRGVVGLRMVDAKEAGAPGPGLGLARAFLVPLDLPISPVLQRRYFDRLLKVEPEAVPLLSRKWQRGLGWQGVWLVLLLASVWFVVMPTRREALTYLKRLDGWRCCNSRATPSPFTCSSSVSRAVRAAKGGDEESRAVVAQCPRARSELGR
ncbi:hypothetical protein [Archangium sp.]|jgi:hypothetical protein|uniref:hypothetical protein n=1 Tax=Archangium sp. TaxID=1872627 RepID=UPI002ED92832